MGLLRFLQRLFLGPPASTSHTPVRGSVREVPRRRPRLVPLHSSTGDRARTPVIQSDERPYRFARFSCLQVHRGYLDFSTDGDNARLAEFDLPRFHTPEQLADWLSLPLGQLAWLIYRFSEGQRPQDLRSAHYHIRWMKKRGGGWRLIESPKACLKSAQTQILEELLDCIPAHNNAHGFVPGRSIVSNAEPHVGNRVLVKLDLENFYPSVTFSRVTAIFRGVGYSREAALWLAHLTTSPLPPTLAFPDRDSSAILPYLRRHLPQGAPTSPALANLSAFSLDVRLSGMADAFGARYTRYADDLTFSGSQRFLRSLRVFLPLVRQIISSERFRLNRRKLRIIRDNQRQTVTGVVVNDRVNVSRADYDRLKAILHNCARSGPASQNREGHENFASHLRGKIAHVTQLNPDRGAKLLAMYDRVDWSK